MRIGIDLGGSKIEAAALDEDGATLVRRRVSTPRHDYQGTLTTIKDLVDAIEFDLGCRGSIGVGTPGSISPFNGRMRNANSVWLNDQSLDKDLQAVLGRPVRLANDADCFALSEAIDGAGRGAGTVFGVIIGTGTGAGVVVNGRLLNGPNAIAGEWGHNPLPWPNGDEMPGPCCYCGLHGCIETYVSGPGMTADHHRRVDIALTPPEILQVARNGDKDAEETLRRHEDRLARGLASVINILDPDVIVLGGGLSNLQRLYRRLPDLIRPYVFSDSLATRIVPPAHGDSGGVRGAAWLWNAISRP